MSRLNKSRPGYKKIKVGWIPEEWDYVELSTIVNGLNAGVSVNSYDERAQGNELGVLKTSSTTYGYFQPEANKRIRDNEKGRARVSPTAESVIISRMNTKELVGANAFIEKNYPNLRLPDRLWQMRVKNKKKHYPRWLGYLMASSQMRSILSSRASGTSGSMKNISKQDVLTIKVPLPPLLLEQKKIAEILFTWDMAIEQVSKLINAKTKLKKALMQQLLTGKWRFKEFEKDITKSNTRYGVIPSDWSYPKVGEIAEEVSNRNTNNSNITVLSCTKYDGLVESLKYFSRQVFSKDTSAYKVVKRGQIAYATNHIEEGSIGMLDFLDEGLVSPMYTVFQTGDRVYTPFLYKVFKTELYRHIFEVNTSASVNRRGSLRWHGFALIHVPLPSFDEQQKISDCIDASDRVIRLLEKKVDTLKEQKKSLMQKLLTGDIRVKVLIKERTRHGSSEKRK